MCPIHGFSFIDELKRAKIHYTMGSKPSRVQNDDYDVDREIYATEHLPKYISLPRAYRGAEQKRETLLSHAIRHGYKLMTESIIRHPSFSPASQPDLDRIFDTTLVNEFIIRFGRSSFAFRMMCTRNNTRAIRNHLLDAQHSPLDCWNMHELVDHTYETPLQMIIKYRNQFGYHMFKELIKYIIDTGQSINMPYQTTFGHVAQIWYIKYDPAQSTTIYHVIAPVYIDFFSIEETKRAPFDAQGRTPYMLNYSLPWRWKKHHYIREGPVENEAPTALCVGGDRYKQRYHFVLGRGIHEKIFMIYACAHLRAEIPYEIIEEICGFFKLNKFLDDFVGAYGI